MGPLGSGRTENAIYHFALNIVSAFTGTLLKSPQATEVGTSESAKHNLHYVFCTKAAKV